MCEHGDSYDFGPSWCSLIVKAHMVWRFSTRAAILLYGAGSGGDVHSVNVIVHTVI